MRIAYERILKTLAQAQKSTERALHTYKQNDDGSGKNDYMIRIYRQRLKDMKDMLFIIEKDQARHG